MTVISPTRIGLIGITRCEIIRIARMSMQNYGEKRIQESMKWGCCLGHSILWRSLHSTYHVIPVAVSSTSLGILSYSIQNLRVILFSHHATPKLKNRHRSGKPCSQTRGEITGEIMSPEDMMSISSWSKVEHPAIAHAMAPQAYPPGIPHTL